MGLLRWLKQFGDGNGHISESPVPAFEQLEPRLLLSADGLFSSVHPQVETPYESAIVVELDESIQTLCSHHSAHSEPVESVVDLTLSQDDPLVIEEGLVVGASETLRGSGTIEGDVVVAGVFSPGNSPGVVAIDGNLTMDSGDPDTIDDTYSTPHTGEDTVGTIEIELAGTGAAGAADGYDQINVSGEVDLGGTLSVKLLGDYAPILGDTFDFLIFGSKTNGKFDSASGLFGFGDGSLFFEIEELADRLRLVVKKAPAGEGLGILPDTQAEADSLGMFYSEYFSDVNTVSQSVNLNIFGFAVLNGSFSFEKTKNFSGDEIIAGGASGSDGIADLTQTTIKIGGTLNEVFIGSGYGTPDKVGLEATGGVLGIWIYSEIDQRLTEQADAKYAVKGSLASVGLYGIDSFELSGSDLDLEINRSGQTLDGMSIATGAAPVNMSFVDTGTADVTRVGGAIELGIAGFIDLEGSLYIEKVVSANGDNSITTLEIGGTLTHAYVGSQYNTDDDKMGLEASGGVLGIWTQSENDQAGASVGETLYAVKGTLASVDLVGIDDLTLSASNMALKVNRSGSKLENITVDTGEFDLSDQPILVDMSFDTVADVTRISGTATLIIDDYVYVNGSMAFEKGAERVATLNDIGATTQTVSYLTIGATSVDVFAGSWPNSSFVDTNNDGIFDGVDNPDAMGLAIYDVAFGLALMTSDTGTYYACKASASSVDLVGFEAADDFFEFDISDVTVQVNSSTNGKRVVDFTRGDLDGDGDTDGHTQINTGPGVDEYIELKYTDKLLQAAATMTLKIDDFVFIQGSLGFQYSQERSVVLSDGSSATVSAVDIAATGVQAFVGLGPYDLDAAPDVLVVNEDAVGLAVNDLSFGFSYMRDNTSPSRKYFALKGTAQQVTLQGIPEVAIGVEDIILGINYSTHEDSGTGARVVVNFAGEPLMIDTGPDSSVEIDYGTELIRASLSNGTFELNDSIYLSGNFAFEMGEPTNEMGEPITVNIATNIPGAIPPPLNGIIGDTLEGVEVRVLYLGASDVNGFVGLNGPYYNNDGSINADATGLSVRNLDFGFVMMEPAAGGVFAGCEGYLPKFYALKASTEEVALVGIPDITLAASEVTVEVNFGTTWIAEQESSGRPVVDFASSFEAKDRDGDGEIDPAGFELKTGSKPIYIDYAGELLIGASVGHAILQLSEFVHISGSMAFELGATHEVTVDTGMSAELLNLLTQAQSLAQGTALKELNGAISELGLNLAEGTIEHKVVSFTVGGANLSAFVGMDGPYWTDLDDSGGRSWVTAEQVNGETIYTQLTEDADDDGYVDVVTINGKQYGDINTNNIVEANETAELNENAVGLVAADLDFGLAVMQSNDPVFDALTSLIRTVVNVIPGAGQIASILATALGEYLRPRYYALKGSAGQVGLVGLDEIVAEAFNMVIEMNVATPALGICQPSLNFKKSFGAAGLQVETGDDPVCLDFEGPLVRASVQKATLQVSEFLYLNGSFAFDMGSSHEVVINSGMPTDVLDFIDNEISAENRQDLEDLGLNLADGTITHDVNSMSIGGSNVTAFAGINGPYWVDTNEDGIVDQDEINEDAIGLVSTDFDFGIAVMQSDSEIFNLLQSMGPPGLSVAAELLKPRYLAVKGNAHNVGFVGLDDITAEMRDLVVEMNVGTPWGPLLPSIDFVKSFPGEDLNDNQVLDTEDLNGNGVLDTEDINGNGVLDPGEDTDGDGVIDYGEDANEDGIFDFEDTDGDGVLDPAGFEVFTGSESFYMDFEGGVIRASVGQATLRVLDLVAFSGSFAFTAEADRLVRLTDDAGTPKHVSILTIAAQDVYGFVGVDGPYRWDSNDDGVIDDRDPVNTAATGFAVDNFDFGMAIAVGRKLSDPSLYFAMKATADTFDFVGLDGVDTESSGININVNVGLSPGSTAAIDFSFFEGGGLAIGTGETNPDTVAHDPSIVDRSELSQTNDAITLLVSEGILETVDNEPDLFRFNADLTDEGELRAQLEQLDGLGDIDPILAAWRSTYQPRLLDFARSLLKGHIAAKISFMGAEFNGSFGFDATSSDSVLLTVLAHFTAHVDDLELYESLAAGVLVIGDGGMAGKILLESRNADPLAGLDIEGLNFQQDTRFDLLINTTRNDVDILLPDYFDVFAALQLDPLADYSGGVILADKLTTLQSTDESGDLQYHLHISKNQTPLERPLPDQNDTSVGQEYLLIHADGDLLLPGMQLHGTFDFKASATEAMLIVDADFKVGAGGLSLLELEAAGVIRINQKGIAGKIKLRHVDGNLLDDLNIDGLNIVVDSDTRFDLLINTTKEEARIELPQEFDAIAAFGLLDTNPANYVDGVLLPDDICYLETAPRGPPGEYDQTLILPDHAVLPGDANPDPAPAPEVYILVNAEVKMTLPGTSFEGSFNLFADESSAQLVMAGNLKVGFGTLELLDLVAGGVFQLDAQGFAGTLHLTQTSSVPFGQLFEDIGDDLGFENLAHCDLIVNTTGYNKPILLPDSFDPCLGFDIDPSLLMVSANTPFASVMLADDQAKLEARYNTDTEETEYYLVTPHSPNEDLSLILTPTPEPDTNLGPDGESYIIVHAVGVLAFPGFVLDGGFDLFVYQDQAVMDIHATLRMDTYLEMNALGILQIDDTGLAGKISLEIIDGNEPLASLPGLGDGFGFDAEFDLIVNTTKQYKEIVFPDRFDNFDAFGLTPDETTELEINGSVVMKDGLTRLKMVVDGEGETHYHLIVNNTPSRASEPPVDLPDPNDTGEFYWIAYGFGDLRLPGAVLHGDFYILGEETQTVMTMSGRLLVGFEGVEVLNLKAGGAFYVGDDGLAGKLQLTLDGNLPFEALLGDGLGFNGDAHFDLTINLTGTEQDFTLPQSFDARTVFGIGQVMNPGDEVLLSDNLTKLALITDPVSSEDEYHLIVAPGPQPGADAELYLLVHAVGELSLPGLTMQGGFDLFVNQERATMDIHALTTLGYGDLTLLQLEAIGVTQVDWDGLAGKIHLQVIDGANPPEIPGVDDLANVTGPLSDIPGLGTESGFDAGATFDLIVNTTGKYKDILLPDRFENLKSLGITDQQEADLRAVSQGNPVSVVLPDGLTRLKSVYVDANTNEYHLIINNTPNKDPEPPLDIPANNDTGSMYLVVYAYGNLTMPGVQLHGKFDLLIDESHAVMTVCATANVGAGSIQLCTFQGAGVLQITADGMAGKVKLTSQTSIAFAGMTFVEGKTQFDLLINTTGKVASIKLPDGFDIETAFGETEPAGTYPKAWLSSDGLTSIKSESGSSDPVLTLLIPRRSEVTGSVVDENDPTADDSSYILVHGEGELTIIDFTFNGNFDLKAGNNEFELSINASLALYSLGTLTLTGDLIILAAHNGSLGVAGSIDFGADNQTVGGIDLGLTFDGRFTLEVDTIGDATNGIVPYIRITMHGDLTLLDALTLRGDFSISYSSSTLTITIDQANLTIATLGTLAVNGEMTIEQDGVVGVLDLEATTPITIFGSTLSGTFKLSIDTKNNNVFVGVSNGALQLIGGFKIEGDFSISYNDSTLTITIDQANITIAAKAQII